MFETKQSDLFYNDETGDFIVCQVSAITAERCEGSSEVLSGAAPIVYRIEKDTNYKSLIYPESLNTFDVNNLFDLTPNCETPATGFSSITKPLINYNKAIDRYSVTFLGSYSTAVSGMSIMNYVFQPVDSKLKLLKSNAFVPKDGIKSTGTFTFESGYLNSDLLIGGNSIRNGSKSFFSDFERAPDYQVPPTHVETNNTLGFNLIQDKIDTSQDALIGDKNYVLMDNGSYITYKSKYTAFDPNHTIRVEFTARAFNVPSMTAYRSAQTTEGAVSASRWVQQYSPAGAGEGFCVYFHDAVCADVQPNGVGSTLGYAHADTLQVETAGDFYPVSGLFIPVGDKSYSFEAATDKGLQYNTNGYLAESYLGVGFDLTGQFSTTSDDKTGWFNGTSWTKEPSSIGIRGNRYFNTPVLTCVPLTSVAASANPMWVDSTHASQHDAPFVDYRVDLSNKGNRLTVYNKASGSTTWKTILDFRLNSVVSSTDGRYERWGLRDGIAAKPRNLNVGLSFTTSTSASHFELKKFEVTGVSIKNPCEPKVVTVDEDEEENPEIVSNNDYLDPFSKALRLNAASNVISSKTNGRVNFSMIVPAKGFFRNQLFVERNKVQETLCDVPQTEDEPIMVINAAGVKPEDLPGILKKVERGEDVGAIFSPRVLKTPEEREKDFEKLVAAVTQKFNDFYGKDKVEVVEITHTISVNEYKKGNIENDVSFEASDLNPDNNLGDMIREGGKGTTTPTIKFDNLISGEGDPGKNQYEKIGDDLPIEAGETNVELRDGTSVRIDLQDPKTLTLPDIALYKNQFDNDAIAASDITPTGSILWDGQKVLQLSEAQGNDINPEIQTVDVLTLSETTDKVLGAGGEGLRVDNESIEVFDDWAAAFGTSTRTIEVDGVFKTYTGAELGLYFYIPAHGGTIKQSTTYTKNNLGYDLYIDLPNIWSTPNGNSDTLGGYTGDWGIGSAGIVAPEAPTPRTYTQVQDGNNQKTEKYWIPDNDDYASSGNLHFVQVDGHTTSIIVPHTFVIGPDKLTEIDPKAGFGMFIMLMAQKVGMIKGGVFRFICPNGLRMYPEGFTGKKEKIGHVYIEIDVETPTGAL